MVPVPEQRPSVEMCGGRHSVTRVSKVLCCSRVGKSTLPASADTALTLPVSGAQRLHLHSDFAFSGSEADSFAPNLDHSPHEILCQKLSDRKDLPLS